MFKLIKILNTGVNVPEPEQVGCNNALSLDAGTCVVYDESSGKIDLGNQNTTPTHVLVKAVKKGDSTALCYRITPEMIFEVPVIGDPSSLYVGISVELAIEANHGAYAVTDVEDGPAKLYSFSNATKHGDKVLVTFSV